MTAGLLREASKVLREHAEAATPGPWFLTDHGGGEWAIEDVARFRGHLLNTLHFGEDEATGRYVVLVAPPVALALAEWLDAMAFLYDQTAGVSPAEQRVDRAALATARAILRRSE